MAVLIEAISVVVRRDSIDSSFRGGWEAFQEMVPNAALCTDGELARVSFMGPNETLVFVRELQSRGLVPLHGEKAGDFTVVDQLRGIGVPTDWAQYARVRYGETGGEIAICWFFTGDTSQHGHHFSSKSMPIAVPEWWEYEESLSAKFRFVLEGEMKERMKFLRSENGVVVYLDLQTNQEVFMGKTRRSDD